MDRLLDNAISTTMVGLRSRGVGTAVPEASKRETFGSCCPRTPAVQGGYRPRVAETIAVKST